MSFPSTLLGSVTMGAERNPIKGAILVKIEKSRFADHARARPPLTKAGPGGGAGRGIEERST